jgi:hypothetical protein
LLESRSLGNQLLARTEQPVAAAGELDVKMPRGLGLCNARPIVAIELG